MNRFSNLTILGKSTDINFRSLSFSDKFLQDYQRNIKNINNTKIRKKVFEAYSQFRNNFPKAEAPTGEIQTVCKEIINTFFHKSTTIMRENFASITDSKLESLAIKVKDIFKRMMGVDNTVVCFDKSETSQPIKVFLDVSYNYEDMNKLTPDPLAFKIENGFFKFLNQLDRIHITIIINFEYIRNLINKNYITTDLDTSNPSDFEESYRFGNNFYLKINDIINRFWKDFLGAFTLALYKDRYREAMYAKIYGYLYLINEDKKRNFQLFYCKTKEEFLNFVSLYRPIIENLQLNPELRKQIANWIYPDISYMTQWDFFEGVELNKVSPIDLYIALFEPLQIEISTLRAKLRIYQTLDPETSYTHLDGNLDDLNHVYKDETTNLVVSSILLKRLTPIIIFTEIFLNKSAKFIELTNIINKFTIYTTKLKNYASYSMVTKSLVNLIENIELDKKLLSSSRSILISSKLVIDTCDIMQRIKNNDIENWDELRKDVNIV